MVRKMAQNYTHTQNNQAETMTIDWKHNIAQVQFLLVNINSAVHRSEYFSPVHVYMKLLMQV